MTLYTALITLILIMDPFGNIPLFLTTLERFRTERRRFIILRESLFAFVILAVFLFFGQYILKGLQLSQAALSLSGGIILFLIAIRMIFPGTEQREEKHKALTEEEPEDPILVPLAVPLQAGPSAMAFVILSSSRFPEERPMLLLALLGASLFCTAVLLLSDMLRKVLGNRILRAIEKLMGMILTTMAIQMLLSGMSDYIK